MNQQQDEVAAAQQLKSVLGGLNFGEFGWVRVVQVLFRHIQWTEINEALRDYRLDHETVLGAINNLRQVEVLSKSASKRLRADYGRLFEIYFMFTRDLDHGWTPEREQHLRLMITYVQAQEIPVSDEVSKLLKQDYPSLWRR